MIRINKNALNLADYPQDLFDGIRTTSLNEILNNGKVDEKNTLYRTEEVRNNLYRLYNSKCAYCESKENNPRIGTLHIEHYRPKNWRKTRKDQFNGYYWLIYEWTNLLLACRACNSKKGTKFPLYDDDLRKQNHLEFLNQHGALNWLSTRIDSDMLRNENPTFLNPEVDNPDDFLRFRNDGQVIGVGLRGVTTIHIELGLGLNDPVLIENRYSIIKKHLLEISELIEFIQVKISSSSSSEESIRELTRNLFFLFFMRLENGCDPENEFSRFRKCIYEDFENFIVSYLPDNIKSEIRNYFIEYKAGTL